MWSIFFEAVVLSAITFLIPLCGKSSKGLSADETEPVSRLLHLYRPQVSGSAACSTSCTDILPLLPEGLLLKHLHQAQGNFPSFGRNINIFRRASGKSPLDFGFS
ncbi:hypothetical protein Ct9H90mP29_21760 [bacterium]|nr:MAG: hypothetical protein Ct9H90mP29_21760 [bacterium]